MDWELDFLHWIMDIRTDFLTAFGKVLTYLGDKGIFWIALCLILLIIPKTRKIGLYAGIALAFSALSGELILKHIIQRDRPFVQDTSLTTIIPIPTGKYSLPSGHSASSAAVSVSVFIQNKKLGIPLMVLAVMIMLSRIYFCVHFPTDIVCGLVLGTVSAIGVYLVLERIQKKRREKIPE